MKKTKILVLAAVLIVAAFAVTASVHFSNRALANHLPEVISECDIERLPHGTPPTGLKEWVLYTRDTGSGSFILGPGDPPLSDGSLSLQTTTGNDKVYLFNYEHIGTPLNSIDEISYSTFRTAGSLQQVTALNLEVDVNGAAPGGYTVLVFEPVYNTDQGLVSSGEWQDWDAYNGGDAIWWSSREIPGVCAFSCYVKWEDILSANPDAIIVGGFGVNQGGGNPGLNAATDALTIGYGNNSYSYNFDIDDDCDDVADSEDNCPTANHNQADNDNDNIGDVCDPDDDNDGVLDSNDAFPFDPNESVDTDGDGIGNNADTDDDNDGQTDADETACGSNPLSAASKSLDTDSDNKPNCVDTDDDNDGVLDGPDNCDLTPNPNQDDFDGDGIGDACETGPVRPTNKDQCKNGGWMNFAPRFKNQGDCIQFFNTGK